MIELDRRKYILSRFPGKSYNANGRLHAKCPFHDDNHPSFSINENGDFICGSATCGIRGGFALFYKLSENIHNWKQVYEDIKASGVVSELDVRAMLSPVKPTEKKGPDMNVYPRDHLVEEIGSLDYFTHRGFSPDQTKGVCAAYGLMYGRGGYHHKVLLEGTIVVPIYDLDGTYKTYQVRYLDPRAKMRWNNPTGSPLQDLLYGGWLINDNQKDLLVVEGASDCWNLWKHGYQSVGLFTKEATTSQRGKLVELARKFDLTFSVMLDGDTHSESKGYGADYPRKIHSELLAFGLKSRVIYLASDQDPGGLMEQQIQDYLAEGGEHEQLCSSAASG